MDQLLRDGKIPARSRSYRGGLTSNPSTHRRWERPQHAFHKYSEEDGPAHLQDAHPWQRSFLRQWSYQSPLGRKIITASSISSSRWRTSTRHIMPSLADRHWPNSWPCPHYIYLLLKMPGKTGVLTLRDDLKKSYDCEQEAIEYATTSHMPEPSAEVLADSQKLTNAEMEISNQRPSQSRVKPNPSDVGIKAIQLQEGDSSKTALIGAA
jgi:hypothetical protein